MGGVTSVKAQGGTKTPLLLLKNGAINTTDFDITPIGTSTLTTGNLYAATFTSKATAKNVFKFENLDVKNYDKAVIKYSILDANEWRVNTPVNHYALPSGTDKTYEIDLSGVDTYSDFTVFSSYQNHTVGSSITISEVYLYKKSSTTSISLFNFDNFTEIPQEQDLTGGGDAAAKDVSDGITTYTTVGGVCVVFKMLKVNVKDYDYILFKFAEPVPAGLSYSFWEGQENRDLPAGVNELKYVFADDVDDPGCAINSGIIPQISLLTLFKNGGKIVKVAGVYGHKASAPADTRTFSCDKALDFTDVEGLKAYAITGFNPANATLTLTQVYKVPANTGLYLEGTGGEYEVPVIESASAIAGNMLVASGDGTITQTSGDKTNLVLAKTTNGRGFHPLSSDGNMGTNKAYLQLPTSEFSGIAEASLRFVFEDEEATGIEEVATPIVADGVWYTINGVKLAGEPTEKGIYIFNGKKVAIQ